MNNCTALYQGWESIQGERGGRVGSVMGCNGKLSDKGGRDIEAADAVLADDFITVPE